GHGGGLGHRSLSSRGGELADIRGRRRRCAVGEPARRGGVGRPYVRRDPHPGPSRDPSRRGRDGTSRFGNDPWGAPGIAPFLQRRGYSIRQPRSGLIRDDAPVAVRGDDGVRRSARRPRPPRGRNMSEPILTVSDLTVTFPSEAGTVRAVQDLSYEVRPGEALAIVGESGSGKSVSSLAVMGLLPRTATITGGIEFMGEDMFAMNDRQLSALRGDKISMIFQDPLSALTPVYTIGDQIAEAIELHDGSVSKSAAQDRAVQLLEAVGIPHPKRRAKQFPHEFSGGMRQRAMIAMAIANEPELIIA